MDALAALVPPLVMAVGFTALVVAIYRFARRDAAADLEQQRRDAADGSAGAPPSKPSARDGR